jgi:diguanylate cyclase (GGDEF)-like protein
MTEPMRAEALAELQLFRGESPESLEWLLDIAEIRELPAETVLFNPEQRPDKLYFLLRGCLRVELKMEGRPVITYIKPGECVGELSVLDDKPAASYVIADEPSLLLAIGRDAIWRLINTSHTVARNLLYLLSSRLRNDNLILSESLSLQRQYMQKALIDSLTGLYNRYWLEQTSARLVQRAQTAGRPLGVMLADLDHFKDYNDHYGHQAGDEALRVLGATVKRFLRPDDFAVRYGGEEFLIIMPEVAANEVLEAAERLRRAIAEAPITGPAGRALPRVTASIGVACLQREQGFSALLEEADKALYRAKAEGRNRVVQQG